MSLQRRSLVDYEGVAIAKEEESRTLAILLALLRKGADPNCRRTDGSICLHEAVRRGPLQAVQVNVTQPPPAGARRGSRARRLPRLSVSSSTTLLGRASISRSRARGGGWWRRVHVCVCDAAARAVVVVVSSTAGRPTATAGVRPFHALLLLLRPASRAPPSLSLRRGGGGAGRHALYISQMLLQFRSDHDTPDHHSWTPLMIAERGKRDWSTELVKLLRSWGGPTGLATQCVVVAPPRARRRGVVVWIVPLSVRLPGGVHATDGPPCETRTVVWGRERLVGPASARRRHRLA